MMQYDNNDTDKTLRQLENQSLPDLSKMDEHWAQMKATLTTSGQSGNADSLFRKPGFYLLAATITGLLFVAILVFNKKTAIEEPISKAPEIQRPVDTTKPSIQSIPPVTTVETPASETVYPPKSTTQPPLRPPGGEIMTLPQADTDFIPTKRFPPPDYSRELANFFKQLEKPAQQFVIDPLQDTVLEGKDGSMLMIPANTFNRGPVTILLKEFYSYKDIITNRLSTRSGGNPLITGGMLHITATVEGKEVNMQPGRSIKWFIPDTTEQMKQMQLFNGVPQTSQTSKRYYNPAVTGPQDTVGFALKSYVDFNEVDWVPQQRYFANDYFATKVKVLDLRDAPMRTRNTINGMVAIFRLSDNPRLSRRELEKILLEKYPQYYKVKVKEKVRLTRPKHEDYQTLILPDGIGDSIWVSSEIAKKYDLEGTDTITALNRQINYEFGPRRKPISTITTVFKYKMASRFGVDIRTLGWINCDRFLNDRRPKINYTIELNDTASNYYTMLIFDGIRSMMAGIVAGNKVIFDNVPEGIKGKIICVGIRDGETISATADIEVSKTPLKDLKFEETNPDEFKKEVSVLDK